MGGIKPPLIATGVSQILKTEPGIVEYEEKKGARQQDALCFTALTSAFLKMNEAHTQLLHRRGSMTVML